MLECTQTREEDINSILFIVFLSLWWGWTVIIDFVVVPTVFSTIRDFFNAGELGMALFSKLNYFEVVTASALVVLSSFQLKKSKQNWPFLAGSLVLFSIALFYFAYLTPKIISLTALWQKAEQAGLIGIAGIGDIQQEQQFFHKLYIKIDSLKLILITILLGFGIYRENKRA